MTIAEIIDGLPVAAYKRTLFRNLLPGEISKKEVCLHVCRKTEMIEIKIAGETVFAKTFDEINNYGQIPQEC